MEGGRAGNAPGDGDDDGKEWGKKVEEALRGYITTRSCRRDATDAHFNNPAPRKREFVMIFPIFN